MRLFLISVAFLISGEAMASCPALFDRRLNNLLEQPQSLCDYAGKVVLVPWGAGEHDGAGGRA